MRTLLLAAAALVFASCGAPLVCSKCMRPPALEVQVLDAETGSAIANAEVAGKNRATGRACQNMGCGDGCFMLDGDASGTYEVAVKAAGYTDASLTFDIEEDGCGMWDGERREVKLRKAAAAEVMALESALGCGH